MLKERLQKVLDYIQVGDRIVDVGCDHGYLGLAALAKGVSFVQLVDNKKMPLQKAMENLQDYLDSPKVKFTLASGLTEVNEAVNVACICGMGGDLIAQIIEESLANAKRLMKLILQPNTKAEHLRKYLNTAHFQIIDETIALENDKYYPILVVKYNETTLPLTDVQIKYGPILLEKHPPHFACYIKKRIIRLDEIIQSNQDDTKIEKIIKEKEELKEILHHAYNENNKLFTRKVPNRPC